MSKAQEQADLRAVYERLDRQLNHPPAGPMASLAVREWRRLYPQAAGFMEEAGVLETAARVAGHQAEELMASLVETGMTPEDARMQAIRERILRFDPAAATEEDEAEARASQETGDTLLPQT